MLTEIKERIKNKNYVFEVCLPCGRKCGKHTLYDIRNAYDSLEGYLKKIVKPNEQEALQINLYAKNGSSLLKKESIEFFYNPTNYVNTSYETNAIKSVNTQNEKNEKSELNGKSGKDEQTEITHYNKINTVRTLPTKYLPKMNIADLEAVQLKTENKYLSEKVDELKTRNKELERKNDEYFNENLRLTRENYTEKDKRDLEFKQKELDLFTKQKQGLSGIMEEVKTMPPEAWQFVAGLIPNHPMAQGMLQQQANTNNNALNGAGKHTDPDAQACLEVMESLLMKQSPEIVGMAAMLTEHLVTHPAVLKAVYEKFFPPEEPKANTTTNTTPKT